MQVKTNNIEPISDFITEMEKKKIKLWVDGETLRYKAPSGVVTKEILKSLGERKAEILVYLQSKSTGSIYSAPIQKLEEKEYYPLSAAQQRMFLLNQMDKESTAYNLTQVSKIDTEFDINQLTYIIKQLMDRHENLRTSFEIKDGKPIQRIHKDVELNIEYEEVEGSETVIDGLIKEFIRPYNLAKPPLFRYKLVKLKKSTDSHSYYLLQDMHHIISDGVSEGILVKEFNEIIAKKNLPEMKIQYKDYVAWHEKLLASDEVKAQKQFWLESLQGELPILNLPTDFPRQSVFSYKGESIKLQIDKGLTDKLHTLAHENRVALFTVLLSAYNVLLSKYTGQSDIIIGTPTAGRRHADLYNIIGVFISTLVLRNSPEPEKTFAEFLKEVGANSLRAFDNQDYPFEQLVEDLNIQRDMSRNPIFDTMFILQNMNIDDIKAEGLKISRYEFNSTIAQFDVTIIATENKKGIDVEINYCTSLFKKETMQRFAQHFSNILEKVACSPKSRICEIDMLSEQERTNILVDFNNTQTEYQKTKTIHELFQMQVEKTPNSVALVFKDETMTYRELNERANQLAKVLVQKGVNGDSIVGLAVRRSIGMVVGMMAILKAGGAYLPIDPEYPQDRVRYMLEDSEAKIVLMPSPQTPLQDWEMGLVEVVDITDQAMYTGDSSNLTEPTDPNSLAYVIYTSGSTGKPKGVMLEHRSVINFIQGITDKIDFTKSILALTTISFDIHVLETLLPLLKGLQIIIADENEQRDSKLLNDVIDKNDVDMLQITPSRLQLLLKGASNLSCLKKLKTIMVGGEAFPLNLLNELKTMTQARIYNMYGPTETTVWSTVGELTHSERIDIGKPIANTQIYILDKNNNLQPIGVLGELCIAGDGLARGYFNRSELTAEKFVSNPFAENQLMYRTGDMARWLPDGRLECCGRIDQQVKIRGYRIELGEIEKHLSHYEGVVECAVVAKSDAVGNKYLVAYYASVNEIAVAELRSYLAKSLPDYMVPEMYIYMEKLPVTPNGKIDRKALPDPDYSRPKLSTDYKEAETETQKIIVEIWQEVLKRELVGVEDNFFELGGNSLLLVNMHAGLEKHFPNKLSVADIFAHPTILKLAQMIDGEQENKIKDMIVDTLSIPSDYFVEGNSNDGAVIRFKLDNELYNSLRDKSESLKDILLGAFVYMFYEVSENEEIPVHTVEESGDILPIKFKLSDVKNIDELIVLAGNSQKSELSKFSLQHLRNLKLNKEMNSVLLLYTHNFNKLYSDHTSYYDIILKTEEENGGVICTFEYNSTRISKEKIEELAYYYVSVLDAITQRREEKWKNY